MATGHEEGDAALKLHKTALGENEEWAVIDHKWLQTWQQYAGVDLDTAKKTETTGSRPGPIDNKGLQSPANPAALKNDLAEGLNYAIIPKELWDFLVAAYGGGPAFIRQVVAVGLRKKTRVELYPVYVEFVEAAADGSAQAHGTVRTFPLKASFSDLLAAATGDEKAGETKDEKEDGKESKGADSDKDKDAKVRIWFFEQKKEVPAAPPITTAVASATSVPAAADIEGAAAAPVSAPVPAGSAPAPAEASAEPAGAAAAAVPAEGQAAGASPAEGAAAPGAAEGATAESKAAPAPAARVRKTDDWKLLEGDMLKAQLEQIEFDKAGLLRVLIEKRNADGSWPRADYIKDWTEFEMGDLVDAKDTVNKWLSGKVVGVKPGAIRVHYNGWADTWDEWIDKTSDRLAAPGTKAEAVGKSDRSSGWNSWSSSSDEGAPPVSGAVGLRNLGNTCFMNSILQCMSHTPLFTDYFLDDDYISHINRDNPLGQKGRIADEYGAFTKEVWSDKFTCVAPRKFKDVIGEFAPRFSGYAQQDSSELLSFLLDGLHEDLNAVRKKPFTQAVESKGRADSVVAGEAWDNHLKRNRSVIVDIFQGQLKSRLECPVKTCGRVSITFDPFMFLSVPLPTNADKVQEVTFVPADASQPCVVYGCTVSSTGYIRDLVRKLSELSGVSAKKLVVAEVYANKIYRFFSEDSGISDIRANDHIFVYEVPYADQLQGDTQPIQVVCQRLEKNSTHDPSYSFSRPFNADCVGLPRVVVISRKNPPTHKELRATLAEIARSVTKTSSEAKLIGLNTDARSCSTCSYSANCLGCEIPDDDAPLNVAIDTTFSGVREAKISFGLRFEDPAETCMPEKVEKHASAATIVSKSEGSIPLSDCIKAFTQEEILSEQDPWYCSDCKDFRQATKKFDLWKLPPVLIIHLKRFSYTRTWRDKISTLVDFPNNLDMSPYSVNDDEKGVCQYELYAVSNHYGNMGGGHYTAYCKNLADGKWYCHDDSRVSPVAESEVRSTAAYVLFYRRKDAPKAWKDLKNSSVIGYTGP